MCGICGLVQLYGAVDESALKTMSDRIAHRGPDDSGMHISADGSAGLGFRRLAIIDLSPTGHQPMTNEDGRLWIVYNGEIYNYADLRKELARAGHEFRTTSDTEVVIHGYEEWGAGVLTRLRGMFAFALWDERDHTLFAARDRLGIKPLHYYWDGERFAFASEIKALLTLPRLKTDLDHSAIWDYFTYLYTPTPKTVYKYIRKLPPAHFLKFSVGVAFSREHRGYNPLLRDYWDVTHWGNSTLSRADAADAVREKLRETVQAHLIADVPVGVLLSGGLDSSAVTAFASPGLQTQNSKLQTSNFKLQTPNSKLQTFSIGFDVAEHSELPFAQIVADAFHTEHRTRVVSQSDFADALAKTIALHDEPFADSSVLPTYAVSQLAAEHVKVALAGDGGDETLAGYFKYRSWLKLTKEDRGSAALRKFVFDDFIMGVMRPLAGLPKMLALINIGQLDARGKEGADRFGALISPIKAFQKAKLLPDLARDFKDYDDYWYLRQYWRDDLDPLSRIQYVDIKTYLHDDILTKVDRASMAASLEARVPLLDHEWVELAASLPSEYRFDKAVLREAMTGILPDAILKRSKKGFSSPLLNWQSAVTRNGARLGGAALWTAQVYDQWETLRA